MLGERYRIVAPIGRGASAQVFLADDVHLKRPVALKMLHAALADDAGFLRRFQAEAQAAAALNDPHVMGVYDWGQDDGIPYLVFEYLSGGSLRGMLDQGRRLSLSQALLIGLEAAQGLQYAHGRGLVHRDIKPANLLFGDEGRLRIADFGLARALAEAAWTEPQGAVLGTARYASPEQAQGHALTGKADVYSLSLVLVEAVTGAVPFTSDTSLGTLMARLDRPVPVPAELGPLRSALQRAGQPDPERRCDARNLARALLAASADLPKPHALPLAGALSAAHLADDPDPTALTPDDDGLEVPGFVAGATASRAPVAADHAIGPVDDAGVELVHPPDPGRAGVVPARAGEGATPGPNPTATISGATAAMGAGGPVDVGNELPPKRRRRWPWLILAVLLVAGLGLGAAAVVADITRTATHTVPNGVVGLDEAAARTRLAPFKWQVGERHTRRDGTEAGTVIAVDPVPGTDLAEDEPVILVVSDGSTSTRVPSGLGGRSRAEAEQAIKARGLVPEVREEFNEDIADDLVIRLGDRTPPTLYKGATVGLVVSKGPRPRTVPDDLVGMTEAEATAALARVQLKVKTYGRADETVTPGVVIVTLPVSGASVARDSVVEIAVSTGPALVAVPDVSGTKSIAEAAARLEAAGLRVGQVRGPAVGRPVGTDPAAGAEVRRRTVVDIVLG